jgi:eukaryotic-like serine/threonine-protein kinase
MTLANGVRLGPYAIQTPLGSGGMGEVYRAIDTRLDRTVAIKVLPRNVADSPTRRQRFERETRAISSLNHPHICTLYDVGEENGMPFLVMEYVEGETLADRLIRGALPIDQVLRHAIEITDALDEAHHHGIVHRDLKPSNIMLTRSGAKLLDFGVAKLWAPDEAAALSLLGTERVQTLTEEGSIVGTVQYMAPEQLEGRNSDARTDIFAFGAVIYETAAGRPAFEGKSQAGLIASILERDPSPLSVAQETMPPLLDQIVRRCLAKDPDERWQTASDLRQALQWIAEGGTRTGVQSSVPRTRRSHGARIAWIAATLVLVIAILTAVAFMWSARGVPADARAFRFAVSPPANATFSQSSAFMAVSPDGHSFAFLASSPQGNNRLWVRSLDSLIARQLPGTDGAVRPFWSPDSRFLAFGTFGKFMKIDVSSGLLQSLADVRGMQGGAWNRDDVILFRPTLEDGRLYRIAAAGGPMTPATTLDSSRAETSHNWPQFLPDGRHFLYLARSTQPEHDGVVYVGSLDATERIRLLSADSHAAYAPPRFLLFMRSNTLLAQPFDAGAFRLTGEAIPLAEEVERTAGADRGAFAVSQNGVLAYRSTSETQLAWFDRGGRHLGSIGQAGHYSSPALSPDEQQIAVARLDPVTGAEDIWVMALASGRASQLTFGSSASSVHNMPLWSPDGSHIAFRSVSRPNEGGVTFYQRTSNGIGDDELLLTHAGSTGTPLSWSPAGRFLVYTIFDVKTARYDLWMVPLAGDRKPISLSRTDVNEAAGQLSPDGRWMAYVSDESGKNEVYVRPFPNGEGKWHLSVNGGIEPTWRGDGKELFYLAMDRSLMAVALSAGSTIHASAPTRLFETRMANRTTLGYTRNQYVVSGDGQRFLINQPAGEASSSPVTIVVNWPSALKP